MNRSILFLCLARQESPKRSVYTDPFKPLKKLFHTKAELSYGPLTNAKQFPNSINQVYLQKS